MRNSERPRAATSGRPGAVLRITHYAFCSAEAFAVLQHPLHPREHAPLREDAAALVLDDRTAGHAVARTILEHREGAEGAARVRHLRRDERRRFVLAQDLRR